MFLCSNLFWTHNFISCLAYKTIGAGMYRDILFTTSTINLKISKIKPLILKADWVISSRDQMYKTSPMITFFALFFAL